MNSRLVPRRGNGPIVFGDSLTPKPLMQAVEANIGRIPRQVSAHAGYYSGDAVNDLTAWGTDVHIPPGKIRHSKSLPPAPGGRIPRGLSVAERTRRKLGTKKGRKRYALRKELPEPVFGQTKQARGFRQFLLTGLKKVGGEWKLICVGHNLLRLLGARQNGFAAQEFWARLSTV